MSRSFKTSMILLMVFAGGITTIAFKIQSKQKIYEGQYYKSFFHPYMQAATMFLGQALSLPIFYYMQNKDRQNFRLRESIAIQQGKELNFNVFLLIIPAVLDLISSTLQYAAFSFVIGSTYQLLKGAIIISTLVISRFYLKKHLGRKQIIGSITVFVGISIVAAANLLNPDSRDASIPGPIGFMFIIGSLIAASFYWAYQQKILRKYYVQPIVMVGYEGLFGLAIQIIIIIIVSFIPCNFPVISCCSFDHDGKAFVQSPKAYFREITENGQLLMFSLLGVFAVANYNIIGVTVTRHLGCLARSICDTTRIILTWLFGLIMTLSLGRYHDEYNWQITDGGVIGLKVFGFVVVIMGNIMFNNLANMGWISNENIAVDQSLTKKLQSATLLTN